MSDRFQQLVSGLKERPSVDQLIPEADLVAKLKKSEETGKPLRIKLGIDPSAPHLTLGHSIPLRKMRQLQDLGHTGVLVVGDFTRRIGDPSGRSSTRALMTQEDIERNMSTYVEQAFKILDPERTEIRYNSEWLGKLTFADVISLTAKYTVARMLERDDFAKRFAGNLPISILELLYPLAQAYDSVAIHADVELGGSDQLFNLLVGRDIQREYGQEPQVILTVPLLIGTDGVHSMSQTVGNYVGIGEAPSEMYGKILSIPDDLLREYFYQLTDAEMTEAESLIENSPRDAKRRLALDIVAHYHDKDVAIAAKEEFDRIHIKHERPTDVPQVKIDRKLIKDGNVIWVISLLQASRLVTSRGEAKRLITQGGVKINDERIASPELELPFDPPILIQVGKRSFVEAV
ncbi:MAG: tyrosine--tRNA ligase [Candidatus Bipolaricaulota bacterium]|nr:tyrosine--tRNA ligase [Candidatus Bipolaricaulota bacterium]